MVDRLTRFSKDHSVMDSELQLDIIHGWRCLGSVSSDALHQTSLAQ